LFDFEADLVLYDLTSTYFEGHGPATLAKHGYSRDGKPRNVQVVVGVVMVAGWPVAHHVWAGNTRDSATVQEVIEDLAKRFRFRRTVFVGDRGMVTESNLKMLREKEDHGFLVGMTRRRNPEAEGLIDRVDESNWLDCVMGINARQQKDPPRTRVQEVKCDREGVRVFVVASDERRLYEERQRTKAMQRVLAALEKVQTRVAKRRLQKPDQVNITPEEAVQHYKDLSEVERGFRSLKDPLGMRPIWHHVARRVKSHIFVAALAFLIERMLERALKDAGLTLSAQSALEALKTIRYVQFRVHGELRSGVTPGSPRARQVLLALKLTDHRPPTAPPDDETTM
jgi:transposase